MRDVGCGMRDAGCGSTRAPHPAPLRPQRVHRRNPRRLPNGEQTRRERDDRQEKRDAAQRHRVDRRDAVDERGHEPGGEDRAQDRGQGARCHPAPRPARREHQTPASAYRPFQSHLFWMISLYAAFLIIGLLPITIRIASASTHAAQRFSLARSAKEIPWFLLGLVAAFIAFLALDVAGVRFLPGPEGNETQFALRAYASSVAGSRLARQWCAGFGG